METATTYASTSVESAAPIGSQTSSYVGAVLAPFVDAWLAARGRFAVLATSGAAAADVTVAAYRGNLVLEGAVADRRVRDAVEATVRALPGVVGVSNRLRIVGEARGNSACDADVRAAVTARLKRARALRGSTVHVASVYDGVVTLTGVAASPGASTAAFEISIRAPGVRRVVNDVALQSNPGAGENAAAA